MIPITGKILVIEDDPITSRLVSAVLERTGLEVEAASDGLEGLRKAQEMRPDLLVLDVMLPGLNGFEVLKQLRASPATRSLPAIMLTSFPVADGEATVMKLGVNHYLDKPLDVELLISTVRIVMREHGLAGDAPEEPAPLPAEASKPSEEAEAPAPARPMKVDAAGKVEMSRAIKTGIPALDAEMGGGIPGGTLTLVEGHPAAGKSVLCQHLAYGALRSGHRVVYFSSGDVGEGLVSQMSDVGLDVSQYVLKRRFAIHPIEYPTQDDVAEEMLAELAQQIERLSRRYDVVVVDSITGLAVYSREQKVVEFFQSCRDMNGEGKTVFIASDPTCVDGRTLPGLNGMLDVHIGLGSRKVDSRMVKALETYKSTNPEARTGVGMPFEVRPGAGLRPLPFTQVPV